MTFGKVLKSIPPLALALAVASACGLAATAADADVLSAKQKRFYITLDGDGASKRIARFGPLSLTVQCRLSRNGKDEVRIIARSSAGGWFASGRNGPLSSTRRVVLFKEDDNAGDVSYDNDDGDGSIAAKTGEYMAIAGETLGLGINVFGHDCVAIGTVTMIEGNP